MRHISQKLYQIARVAKISILVISIEGRIHGEYCYMGGIFKTEINKRSLKVQELKIRRIDLEMINTIKVSQSQFLKHRAARNQIFKHILDQFHVPEIETLQVFETLERRW